MLTTEALDFGDEIDIFYKQSQFFNDNVRQLVCSNTSLMTMMMAMEYAFTIDVWNKERQ